MKPYWFELIKNDKPLSPKPKSKLPLVILGVIGVIGMLFFIPPKFVDKPISQPVTKIDIPVQVIPDVKVTRFDDYEEED
jgi:hypothetical protein